MPSNIGKNLSQRLMKTFNRSKTNERKMKIDKDLQNKGIDWFKHDLRNFLNNPHLVESF